MDGIDNKKDGAQASSIITRSSMKSNSAQGAPTRPPPRSPLPSLPSNSSTNVELSSSRPFPTSRSSSHSNHSSPPLAPSASSNIFRSPLQSYGMIRPESLSLEERLSNFDQSFDLELNGPSEKQVRVSKKVQTLLGVGADISTASSSTRTSGRNRNLNDGSSLEEREDLGRRRRDDEKRVLRNIDALVGTESGNRTPTRNLPSSGQNRSPDTTPAPPASELSSNHFDAGYSSGRGSTSSSPIPPPPSVSTRLSYNSSPKSPSTPSSHPSLSRSNSTFSSFSSPSPSPSTTSFFASDKSPVPPKEKEKRGSTFMGFSSLKNLGRKKSSSSSTISSARNSINSIPMSRSRASSSSSFGDTGALEELEEEEEGEEEGEGAREIHHFSSSRSEAEFDHNHVGIVEESGDSIYVDFSDGDMEELEDDEDELEDKDDPFLAEIGTVRIQVGSKAAALLGLGVGERVGTPESTGMTRGNSKVSSSIGSNSAAINGGGEDGEENLPIFSCQKMDLEPYLLIGNQITRQSSQPTSFLRQKEWRSRFIILSSYLPSSHTHISASSLHCFKSSGPLEKELDRLDLTPASLVYLPEDQHGKSYTLKVTGLTPKERDAFGILKKGVVRKEESWLIALENLEMLKIWMAEIKGVVHELGEVNQIGTVKSLSNSMMRSGSRSSNMSAGLMVGGRESETHLETLEGAGGRSSTSQSMTSISRYQGSHSPLGFKDSSSHAYYKPPNVSTIFAPSLPLPLYPTTSTRISTPSPVNSPPRPPRPPRSPRSPSDKTTFHKLPASTSDKRGKGENDEEAEEDSEIDEFSMHPYRRASISPVNNRPSQRLVIPSIVPNSMNRRSSDDSTGTGDLQSPTSSTNHSRNSTTSSVVSTTSSLLYSRSPAPLGPLPDTPPPSSISGNNSIRTIEKEKREPSRISTISNTSSRTPSISSKSTRSSPPPLPAPTSSLPPLPSVNNSVPLLPLVLPRLVKEMSNSTTGSYTSKFVVPTRRDFKSSAPLPPPTSSLPLLPSASISILVPSTLPAPTTPLPLPPSTPPPPASISYNTSTPPSLPPPTGALPPTPTSPGIDFPKPPPRSLERKRTMKVAI